MVFFLATLVKIFIVIGGLLFLVSYTVFAERRICAAMQDRIGPNRVGLPFTKVSFFGLGQPIADGIKLLAKEAYTPGHVKKFYYQLAPILAMVPPLVAASVVPFASTKEIRIPGVAEPIPYPGVIAHLDVGLLFAFAISSLEVYSLVLAGWSSNSKYPLLGGLRASAQMVSYEIALGLSLLPIFLVTSTLNLSSIVEFQIEKGWLLFPFIARSPSLRMFLLWPFLVLSFVMFFTAVCAETNRGPFDLPESEQELVGGYNTEYGGMKFGLFFLGEYAALIVASGILVTLYFGGWSLPWGWFAGRNHPWWFVGVQGLVFLVKICVFLFVFIWIRWSLPRFRYDQLMSLSWKRLLPVSLGNAMAVAIVLAVFRGNV
ncbi:complex I subunit 1/NuoH family protein [Candidatus Methylacidithermus pantelleriae]|uniref:NADH-quinone oxidoreductase subunit H n=1 Tax=Candidatus Methylacidithermus pantelleriae TaxID=2744239 RepID=A0A8J2FRK8_9BACT|nr:complex I subunit 1 family protein [Candidatus Methylacidithermus pantelleriae]CAF0691943.1 NADH-quinone oxidoreductase subunit H [Candidatus Methylacidithermus pantelleriae]